MRKLEHPIDEGKVTEDNRPVTGTYLDELPVEKVDWGFFFKTRLLEQGDGCMAYEEGLRFALVEEGVPPEKIEAELDETMEMLANLACGIDRGQKNGSPA